MRIRRLALCALLFIAGPASAQGATFQTPSLTPETALQAARAPLGAGPLGSAAFASHRETVRQFHFKTPGQVGAPPFDGEPQFQYTLQTRGRLVSEEEFGAIIVRANSDGGFVRLRDVARIELGARAYDAVSKFNNQPAAAIAGADFDIRSPS